MADRFEVIVVGAGHNGLVTAAYLAKAGRRVLVLERRDIVGGIAVTEELIPGYRFSTCVDAMSSYLAPQIAGDLGLIASGLETVDFDPLAFSPQPDGSCLRIWRDTARTAAEIERYSSADAKSYMKFVDLMQRLAGVLRELLGATPADIPDVTRSDLIGMLGLIGPLRRLGRKNIPELARVLPMTAADLLDEWFESGVVKGAIAASGVRAITWGPREAGTAYMLLHRWAYSETGLFRSGTLVRGGAGKLTETLATAARQAGAEIRTRAPVASIDQENDRAIGVTLENGDSIGAGMVVSSASPRTTFLQLLDPAHMSASMAQHVRNIKYRGSTARVHLALSAPPQINGIAEDELRAGGHVQLAPTIDYLQRAYDQAKYGRLSEHPYLDISVPSATDATVAPAGHHTMSIAVQYAPYHLDGGWNDTAQTELLQTVLATLREYAPGVGETIVDSCVLTPADLEDRFDLPEGNLHHGEMTLDQLLFMRPIPGSARYRTPVDNLYLCGSGSHPGGVLTGLPGRNAARQILSGRP